MSKIICVLSLVLVISPPVTVAQDSSFPNAPISPTRADCREFSQKVNLRNNAITKRYSQCTGGGFGEWDDNIQTISPLTCKLDGRKGGFTRRKACESLLLAKCDAKPIFESKRLEVQKCYADAQNAKQTSNAQSPTNNDYATVTGNDVLVQQRKKISRTQLARNSSIYKNYKNISKRMKAVDDIMNFYSTNNISSLTNIASRIGSFAHSKSTAAIYLQSMRKLREMNQRTMDSFAKTVELVESISINDIHNYRSAAIVSNTKYQTYLNSLVALRNQQRLSQPYVHTYVAKTQQQINNESRISQQENNQYEDDYTPPKRGYSQSEQFLNLYDSLNSIGKSIGDARQQNNNSSYGGQSSGSDDCPGGKELYPLPSGKMGYICVDKSVE